MRPPRIIGFWIVALAALLCVPTGAGATAVPTLEVTHSRSTSALIEGDGGYPVSLALSAAPSTNVVVSLTGTKLVATPSTLTFTPATARLPQSVVVTAVDDATPSDGETRTLVATAASADDDFDAVTRDIEVLVLDDDAVALHVDETNDSTGITEAGAVDTVYVRLGTRPKQPVSVFLGGPGLVATPDMVVVRPDQWNVGQAVTIAAYDDSSLQGPRDTTLTARTVAPDAIWNGLLVARPVHVDDDDDNRSTRDATSGTGETPISNANRPPSIPTVTIPRVWTGTGHVVLRFSSTDPDRDPLRYHVFVRTLAYGARAQGAWVLAHDSTGTEFDSGSIKPFEQRCFRIEAADTFGAQTSSSIGCTHGLADGGTVAATYGWKTTARRGAWKGTVAEPGSRTRLLYFTYTGSEAVLTFIRCRTCASIRMVEPDGTNRIISTSGRGKRVVTVPLNATGRRIWGFYVQGPGTVLLDSFAVLPTTT